MIFYCFVLLLVYADGQKMIMRSSLLAIGDYYVHQMPFDKSINQTKIEHYLSDDCGIKFLTVNTFPDMINIIYGGCACKCIGDFKQTDKTDLTLLNLNSLGVCYAVPGLTKDIFYALLTSGSIISFNSNGSLDMVVPASNIEARFGLQIDYDNRFLYYLEIIQGFILLKHINFNNNLVSGRPLTHRIQKFQIDFNSNDIFGISNDTLYKGKLNESMLIDLIVIRKMSNAILDFTVTPSDIYLIIYGMNSPLTAVSRSDSPPFNIYITFNNIRAIAYFNASSIPMVSMSTIICLYLIWILWKLE